MEDSFHLYSGRLIGYVNKNLFPEMAAEIGAALGTYLGKRSVVAISRDYRVDCLMIKRSCTGGLMSTGIDIIDLSSAPTSTLQFVVRKFGANAGIAFTSSHYVNGEICIKFIDDSGNEMEGKIAQEIIKIYESKKFKRVPMSEIGKIEAIENSTGIYQTALEGFVKRKLIEDSEFNIVLDCSLGPSSILVPNIISRLKADLTTMNAYEVSATDVLPDATSLHRISKTVGAINAELGIILDVEGVKTIAIDNTGRIIPPEDLTALLIREYLKQRKGTIVLSKFFTERFDQAFKDLGAKIIREEDAPGNIGRVMTNYRAVIGATDNGKLFNPVWGPESDGILTALTLLEILAERKTKLNDLMLELENTKAKSTEVATVNSIINLPNRLNQKVFFQRLSKFTNDSIQIVRDTLIGNKIQYSSGWAHFMTTSNPQEILVYCETNKSEDLTEITDLATELSKKIMY
ncbi:MAG: hypothetical protein ACW981_11610 [Candidatus Hodarchaeales archaeon]|jgi:phosphomannomutase